MVEFRDSHMILPSEKRIVQYTLSELSFFFPFFLISFTLLPHVLNYSFLTSFALSLISIIMSAFSIYVGYYLFLRVFLFNPLPYSLQMSTSSWGLKGRQGIRLQPQCHLWADCLHVSQPYEPPRPIIRVIFLSFLTFVFSLHVFPGI
jgi:hypothetical protein